MMGVAVACELPAEARVLREGHNCWRITRARRAALLVDGAAYFEAAAEAIERARSSILLVGWDVHSRLRLRRRKRPDGEGFAELLDRVAQRRRELYVHLLAWDWPMLYALEREALPRLRMGQTHRRVHFRLDAEHPLGGSQHQKILVVDDAVAFCGGLDITAGRWDTPDHRTGDERRSDPGFPSYGAFHDVQLAVAGPAAKTLGDLVRWRWQRATGQALRPAAGGSDPWPEGLAPDFEDVDVGIARTLPEHAGQVEVREVEALYVDALRSARRCVYVENQYFTSRIVGEVIAELLRRPGGPEIVLVTPRHCAGWLEEFSMGRLRSELLAKLHAVDHEKRLRVYHPVLPGGSEDPLTVHSKLMIVDDRILRVGSANLADRSMGLDSECDLAIELGSSDARVGSIAAIRSRLLGEHLGVEPRSLDAELRRTGSLIEAVEALRGGERSLVPLEVRPDDRIATPVADHRVLDPERPIELEEFVRRVLPDTLVETGSSPRSWRRVGLLALLVAAAAAAWRFTPMAELIELERLVELAAPLRRGPGGIVLGALGFALASLLMVPVVVLILACSLLFGWALGSAVALLGALLSAAIGYAGGAYLARDLVRRLLGRRANELSRRLARRGSFAVAALRLVPVAPFTVVNLAAGASHIAWRDFALGTLIGMGPGIVLLCLTAERAAEALAAPDWESVAAAVGLGLLVVGAGLLAENLLAARSAGPEAGNP